MKKNNLHLIRKKILDIAKVYIVKNGWNENLFKSISENSQFNIDEIISLFPKGYFSLLEFYLNELIHEMNSSAKKLNLIQMKTHKKIKEILLMVLRNNQNDKELIKRTYFTLLLPYHHKTALILLYKMVDEIWFLAGDNSTDFNFYSKRILVSVIYIVTVLHWIKNDSFQETVIFLDQQLEKVKKIPEIKSKITNILCLNNKVHKKILKIVPFRQ